MEFNDRRPRWYATPIGKNGTPLYAEKSIEDTNGKYFDEGTDALAHAAKNKMAHEYDDDTGGFKRRKVEMWRVYHPGMRHHEDHTPESAQAALDRIAAHRPR